MVKKILMHKLANIFYPRIEQKKPKECYINDIYKHWENEKDLKSAMLIMWKESKSHK